MLHDVAEQVSWYDQKYSAEDWKDLFTAALNREQRFAPGINGGIVALGARTSKMTVREMSELLEYIEWFGAEKGVRFRAPEAA